MAECQKCGKDILEGEKFVRIRDDREQRSMVLEHDKCCEDASLKRRKMTEHRAYAIEIY